MRLGIFMMPVHPPARSFTETLAEDEEKALYADQLGFDELWLGEHFSASSEPIPSPLMFMASLAAAHQKSEIRHRRDLPAEPRSGRSFAAEVAQFDHMSRGRFMLGIGPGGLLSDFELFGNADRGVRARKTMESIALIQRIWAQDPPYDFPGEFRTVQLKDAIIPGLGIGYMPKPFQKSGSADHDVGVEPQLADRARRRTARLGHSVRQQYAGQRRRDALAELQQSLRRSRANRAQRELARGAQHHGGAERRRGARSRLQRARIEPLFLHLYARGAVAGRHSVGDEARPGHAGRSKPPSKSSPKAACSTARRKPCSTSSSPSATKSARSARC